MTTSEAAAELKKIGGGANLLLTKGVRNGLAHYYVKMRFRYLEFPTPRIFEHVIGSGVTVELAVESARDRIEKEKEAMRDLAVIL